MNKNNFEWKETREKKRFYDRPETDFAQGEPLNPNLVGKRRVIKNVPVKDLPFYMRHPRAFQYTLLGGAALLLFSKPFYDAYIYYTGQTPIKRTDIQLHPKPIK